MTATHHDHNTPYAWKSAPFGKVRKVPAIEGRQWRNQRRPIRSAKRRDWTHDQVEHLVTLLDKGHDYDTIARRLGRTRTAIVVKTKRLRCKMTKRPTVLDGRTIQHLLGLGCSKQVAHWIKIGALKGKARRCVGRTKRRIWAVLWDDLMAFLRDRRYWMAWEAERITDTDLRTEMLAMRSCGRWLRIGEVARRFCVTVKAVYQWIRWGWLNARRYDNHYVWSEDLEGWIPPTERKRAAPTHAPPTDDPGWLDLKTVAARCKVDRVTPQKWIRAGKLSATRHGKCWWVHERDLAAMPRVRGRVIVGAFEICERAA